MKMRYRRLYSWSDSPGGNYADGLAGLSLTLSAPMDLSASTRPALSFSQKLELVSGDSALVEISTDQGATWNTLATFNSTQNTSDWKAQRINLDVYKVPSVFVRFRLTTNTSGVADGWHLDDLSVAEMPDALTTPVVDQVTSSSVRLRWFASPHPQVVKYRVFRSTSNTVDLTSGWVGEVSAGSA